MRDGCDGQSIASFSRLRFGVVGPCTRSCGSPSLASHALQSHDSIAGHGSPPGNKRDIPAAAPTVGVCGGEVPMSRSMRLCGDWNIGACERLGGVSGGEAASSGAPLLDMRFADAVRSSTSCCRASYWPRRRSSSSGLRRRLRRLLARLRQQRRRRRRRPTRIRRQCSHRLSFK